jgi:hypothetical protein
MIKSKGFKKFNLKNRSRGHYNRFAGGNVYFDSLAGWSNFINNVSGYHGYRRFEPREYINNRNLGRGKNPRQF